MRSGGYRQRLRNPMKSVPHRDGSRSTTPAVGRSIGAGLVYAALTGDVVLALVKYWAAHHTGSSAMLSEGVHSTVDAVTELLLLHGLRTGRRPSTANHPIGFGREVFFWNFIVAMVILAVGAGVALVEGLHQVMAPRAIEAPFVSFAILFIALLVDSGSLAFAIRNVRVRRGSQRPWEFLHASRDATLLTVT